MGRYLCLAGNQASGEAGISSSVEVKMSNFGKKLLGEI